LVLNLTLNATPDPDLFPGAISVDACRIACHEFCRGEVLGWQMAVGALGIALIVLWFVRQR
jgi:hypothetical protein